MNFEISDIIVDKHPIPTQTRTLRSQAEDKFDAVVSSTEDEQCEPSKRAKQHKGKASKPDTSSLLYDQTVKMKKKIPSKRELYSLIEEKGYTVLVETTISTYRQPQLPIPEKPHVQKQTCEIQFPKAYVRGGSLNDDIVEDKICKEVRFRLNDRKFVAIPFDKIAEEANRIDRKMIMGCIFVQDEQTGEKMPMYWEEVVKMRTNLLLN